MATSTRRSFDTSGKADGVGEASKRQPVSGSAQRPGPATSGLAKLAPSPDGRPTGGAYNTESAKTFHFGTPSAADLDELAAGDEDLTLDSDDEEDDDSGQFHPHGNTQERQSKTTMALPQSRVTMPGGPSQIDRTGRATPGEAVKQRPATSAVVPRGPIRQPRASRPGAHEPNSQALTPEQRRPSGPKMPPQAGAGVDMTGAPISHQPAFGARYNEAQPLSAEQAQAIVAHAQAGCPLCRAFARGINTGAASERANVARQQEQQRAQQAEARLWATRPHEAIAAERTRVARAEFGLDARPTNRRR